MDDDELDNILDGALEAFDDVRDAPHTVSKAEASDTAEIAQDIAPNQSIHEETASKPPFGTDEASEALEEALNSLKKLGISQDQEKEDVIDQDVKLVEEFLTTLSSSFGALNAQNPVDGQSADATAPGETESAKGAAPEMEKFVDTIVGQLLSEDVLKYPMMQMRTAYEEWLPENAGSLTKEEKERYTVQKNLVEQICDKYTAKADSSEIMDLLSKMQDTGSPPDAILKKIDNASSPSPAVEAPDVDKLVEMCPMQ
ncbi:Peroxisome biogenesis protein 19-1 [Gracilariopsis chorda]|uniref:Peroxisome biogenesis protein 19-1 n=1 Tax=Gracilariopsis chorda TaxID=448386 RepID=A0A2V3J0B5_9FLOR|nr:Peroxisome biogenesis protein 19-1 [Gracilariopsis chorda]|eukprot:PXF47789.1 Peroxisome biogenesis protein 19-1 [Gracilariopsis chorda]